jgi:5-methylcytosine-specific restriction endonuclease McrA
VLDKKQANSDKVKRWVKAHPEKHREMVRSWEKANPEKRREISRRSQARRLAKARQEAITCLGGICKQCGCTDIRCLQIDHMIPLRGIKRMGTLDFYRSIVQGKRENLQILCANCHAIKTYYENGENV